MAETPSPGRVVVLDDDDSSFETLRQLLAEAEVEVERAATYAELAGLAGADGGRCLLLLNLHRAPGGNQELMRALDREPAWRARCVAIDIARALGHGGALPARSADRVIERPLTPRELVELVRGYMGPGRG